MYAFPGPLGQVLFGISKAWLLLFPLVWTGWIQRERMGWPRFRRAGLAVALVSGVGIAALISGVYFGLAQEWFDMDAVRAKAAEIGLGTSSVYMAGAIYWCVVNALLEEYVWRWFVFRHFQRLVKPAAAVVLASLCFTLHHTLALVVYMNAGMNLLASFGVFAGGVIWCLLYLRYRNIWASYLSHLLSDAAIFAIGWILFFG